MKTASTKKSKDLHTVKTMRQIREKLSKEIMNMTFEEEKAYLNKILSKKPVSTL
jgi:hypothetical protein